MTAVMRYRKQRFIIIQRTNSWGHRTAASATAT